MQDWPLNNPWDYPLTVEEFGGEFGSSDIDGDNVDKPFFI